MPEEPTLGEVYRVLKALEGRLEQVLNDHEQRLRKLERWSYAVPPTLLIAAGSVIASILG